MKWTRLAFLLLPIAVGCHENPQKNASLPIPDQSAPKAIANAISCESNIPSRIPPTTTEATTPKLLAKAPSPNLSAKAPTPNLSAKAATGNPLSKASTGNSEAIASASTAHPGMVWIPGGAYRMGADSREAQPDEYPKHTVTVSGFWMDKTEVTNAQFAAFVKATGYITTPKIAAWNTSDSAAYHIDKKP